MTILLASQVKEIDKYCQDELTLIKKAGLAISEEVNRLLSKKGRIIALISRGNNGADGLATLAYLKGLGHDVAAFLIDQINDYSQDLIKNIEVLDSLDEISSFDIVIDGIYGIGFKGQLDEKTSSIVNLVNAKAQYIVSIDIPTGLYPDTGKLSNTYIKADTTIVLQNFKMANVIYPGRQVCGNIILKDIGIPSFVTDKFSNDYQYLDKMKVIFKEREKESHKGDYGKLAIIGGSEGMVGAAIMAAEAGLLGGAGYVFQIATRGLKAAFETSILETLKKYVGKDSDLYFKEEHIEEAMAIVIDMDAIVIGPGLSRHETTKIFVRGLLKRLENTDIKIILDADGINSFEGFVEELPKDNIIITPHYGEYMRLRQASDQDRIEDAMYFANKGIVSLLKGASTVTAYRQKLTVNGSGNPGMAGAGSGDVLAGLIGALSLKMDLYDAGRYGALIHGLAGDKASLIKGHESLLARDLLEMLPEVMREGELH